MTASERKKAQSAMMLLAEKQFKKTIKGRLVFRVDGTREWLSREDTASPTALQKAITTTCVIDAHEGRDIRTMDMPKAFIQTYMPEAKEGEDRIYMKITAMMVQILLYHLTLSAESLRVMKWMIDASFAVHPDFKSHTGGTLSFGGGAAQVMSNKQKLNSRSSTEAELIAVDNVVTMILWTKLFMGWQGYPIEKNILYQDKTSPFWQTIANTFGYLAKFRTAKKLSDEFSL
ncbi:unnamed protein product [Cylindrotheca closterium]|uniref:Uncharacterized protein n=1 Tax=Cylindrotheca closterium TaxID=2856 RepID=A0AAD2FWU0_9STRA|nr:unnamed protein product [Cylindrotheca closterium]